MKIGMGIALIALLASCVGPTLSPASEGWWGGLPKYEIAAKSPLKATTSKQDEPPGVNGSPKACTRPLVQLDAMAADAVRDNPSLVYRKFSPADSAKLIAYINTQPPVSQTFDADSVVALVPGNKEAPVLVALFKAGCEVGKAVMVPHALYMEAVVGALGQDS